jgi:hypothetical protein
MPLPYESTIPEIIDRDYHGFGRTIMDRRMTEETARREEERNPGLHWIGHGNCGIAYETANGTVIKYTDDRLEFEAASRLMENPIPCTVRVYDAYVVQEYKPFLWAIELEKVIPMKESEDFSSEGQRQIANVKACLESNRYNSTEAFYKNLGWNKDGNLVLLDLGLMMV